MPLKCPDCGVSVMSLMAHICGRGKSSDGGFAEQKSSGGQANRSLQVRDAGVAPSPSEAKSEGDKVKLQVRERVPQQHASTAGGYPDESQSPTKALVATRSKRGRPRIGETRDKPWLSCDPPMSERTYRRRLSEQRSKEGGK